MPSSCCSLFTYASARKPLDPEVSCWPFRNPRSASASIVDEESAWLPAKASATPTSAEKPEFDAVGLVIAYRNCPLAAALAMSFQLVVPFFQPSRSATLCFTPTTTGLSMVLRRSRILFPAPASVMYLSLANQAASLCVPCATCSPPSSEPV